MLIAFLLVSGCSYTPAKVASEVPHVLKNVSEDISTMETPNITLDSVLQPIKRSTAYVQPSVLAPVVSDRQDPIIGSWQYVGDSMYQCNAVFTPDKKASASCSAGPVELVQKSFIWAPERNSFHWMRNYTLMDVSDKGNYSIAYSENTGRLTSEVMPGNGYLVKVN